MILTAAQKEDSLGYNHQSKGGKSGGGFRSGVLEDHFTHPTFLFQKEPSK
jgi:hypothetical protein